MHHARLSSSPRLKRTLIALKRAGGEISTMELIREAQICAVNSVIAELRANGAEIICRQASEDGRRTWFYTLIKAPKE